MFNLVHIICRGFVLALLAAYLHLYILPVLCLMVAVNFLTAVCVLKTKFSKHFKTAFAAVLLPTCFVFKKDIKSFGLGQKLVSKFYKVNSLFFFVVSVCGLVVANYFLHFTTLLKYECNNLPVLSYNQTVPCPKESILAGVKSPFDDILDPVHVWFTVIGSSLILGLGILHVIIVFIEDLSHNYNYTPVHPI